MCRRAPREAGASKTAGITKLELGNEVQRKPRAGFQIVKGSCPVCGAPIGMVFAAPRVLAAKPKANAVEDWARAMLGKAAAMALLCFCIVISGCATTVVRNARGQTVFRTEGDGTFEFHGADGSWLVATVNHSGPTIAAGNASAVITDSVGRGVVGGILGLKGTGVLRMAGGVAAAIPTKAAQADAETRGPGDAESKANRLEAASTVEGIAK